MPPAANHDDEQPKGHEQRIHEITHIVTFDSRTVTPSHLRITRRERQTLRGEQKRLFGSDAATFVRENFQLYTDDDDGTAVAAGRARAIHTCT